MGRKRTDITGKRFGMLVALHAVPEEPGSGKSSLWHCRCDCGNEVDIRLSNLRSGNTKSCGCLKKKSQKMLRDRLELVDGTCVEWLGGRKMRDDNKSGCKGVFKKRNGKYCVSIGFKKRVYHIGTYDNRDDAVEARMRAEKTIYGDFLTEYNRWKSRAEGEPGWAKAHPFSFRVEKKNGELVICKSEEDAAM